ncbi:MAG: TonB-dependent receptor plug domain-containing protein [Bacteroidetes bacterium]|nr:TonB-dependent receptor plug domain-containing protein [Bacteroidota bacterium]
MRKFTLLCLLIISGIAAYSQQQLLKGSIADAVTGKPLSGAVIVAAGQTAQSGSDGNFEILSPGQNSFTLTVSLDGYEVKQITLKLPLSGPVKIDLKPSSGSGESAGISDISGASLDMETDNQGQYISGLLHSTSDIFVSTAGYTLGAAYFKIRGYDPEYSTVYMNGIQVNDPENGRPTWSEWGGLNDATRNKEVVNGLAPAAYGYGDIGGSTNISTRASLFGKQQKFSYSYANRAYNHRLMYTASTGLMKNNWSFAFSVSRRWAEEGYVSGTFYDSWAYFAAAEKKINNRNSIALTVYASPTIRGMQGGSTQEVYDLTGDHFYNPNWGYQDGEKRNAKVRKTHEPMIILNHYWKPDEKTKVTNSIGVSFGRNGTTALNWYNARDPRPDYYRYLPSYETDPAVIAAMTTAWQTDQSHSQINWNNLYQANYLANTEGKQANYVVEERRQDHTEFNYNLLVNREINQHISFTGGLDLSAYTGRHFKVMSDLLGGKYWVDIDQFSQRDFSMDTVTLQNDLNNPNKIIKVGDKYGYNYNIRVNNGNVWGQWEFSYNRFDFFAAANVSYTQFWRDGKMKNGRAPDNSYGESAKKSFINPGVKGGFTYKLTGHHFFQTNAAFQSKAPLARNAFISPYIKNTYAHDLKSELNISGDISYIYRGDRFNARVTAYQTIFKDQSEIMSYYHDDYLTYVNMSLTGIDKIHQGMEVGVEWKATTALSFSFVAALGNFIYTSRPTAVISTENGSRPDTMETVYQKNFYVSGTPQNAGSIGFRYAAPKYWYFNGNINYFEKMYLDFNPQRRTSAAITNLGPGDPLIQTITEQQKLNHGFTLDASIGKSLRYKAYTINLNVSVNNILDNQDLITGGYEQLRFDYTGKNIDKFPPKYFYGYGRSFFINLGVRF